MATYQIPVYKAERDAGLVDTIRDNLAISYNVLAETMDAGSSMIDPLRQASAALKGDDQFDLYYLKDILVTTGKNKNKDIFDRVETWSARHTSEDKPFNFEHRPLDIIGHIVASCVVDADMKEIDDDADVEDLPKLFHVVNGSVLYMFLADEERKELMEKTVAEIERNEWYVSMECFFRGFDYGVESADGVQRIVQRNESTAFLTKHLAQYGGSGTYCDEKMGIEYALGRVLRNITFKGKGLVRKPANMASIILNSVAAFAPVPDDLGYLTAGTVATSSKTEEIFSMSEISANEQSLRDDNRRLETRVEELTKDIATLKSKDTEVTISKLQGDVADRDKTIAGLNTQLDAIKDSTKGLSDKLTAAETNLATASAELATVKASELRRKRLDILRTNGAEMAVAEKLADRLATLDDTAFAETVSTISAGWKAAKPKVDPVVDAITRAKPEAEPALATAGEDTREQARASVVEFLGQSLQSARNGRPSIYAASTEK